MASGEVIFFMVIIFVAIYAGVSGYLLLNQSRMIYNPVREIVTTPDKILLDYEQVRLKASDGIQLDGWFVPAPQSRATVLFFHGNTGNISHRLETLKILNELNYDTLIFDYRGYGRSEGQPSEEGTYKDAQAAWDYLTLKRQVPESDIILFGRSLGGAVATWLASHVSPAALIIESSFTSIPDLAEQLYPWLPVRLLARAQYNSKKSLAEVTAPVLLIHSRQDEVIPFSHSETLLEAYQGEKSLLEISGHHNDGFLYSGQVYTSGLRHFLEANSTSTQH